MTVYNKVVFDGRTLIDLSDANVTSDDLLAGRRAYGASGNLVVGNLEDLERVAYFISGPIALADTDFATWTPSTTAGVILPTTVLGTFVATDISNYDYFIRTQISGDFIYKNGTATAKGMFRKMCGENWYSITRRPSNNANLNSGTRNSGVAETMSNVWVAQYYNTAWTSIYSGSYGFYPSNSAPTFSSATAASPTISVKRPIINAKCQATYFSTGMASKLDQGRSTLTFYTEVYRVYMGYKRKSVYESICDIWANGMWIDDPYIYEQSVTGANPYPYYSAPLTGVLPPTDKWLNVVFDGITNAYKAVAVEVDGFTLGYHFGGSVTIVDGVPNIDMGDDPYILLWLNVAQPDFGLPEGWTILLQDDVEHTIEAYTKIFD